MAAGVGTSHGLIRGGPGGVDRVTSGPLWGPDRSRAGVSRARGFTLRRSLCITGAPAPQECHPELAALEGSLAGNEAGSEDLGLLGSLHPLRFDHSLQLSQGSEEPVPLIF